MHEKKPIKRNEHIVPLSREHHFSLLFGWKIRTGIKKQIALDRIKNYVLHFWENNLILHFKQEEEVLFAIHQDSLVERALTEHELLRGAIKTLKDLKGEAGLSKHLEKIADMVTAHVRFEERELFPHLEQILTADQLKKIGHELQEMQPEPLLDNYKDEFWVTQK